MRDKPVWKSKTVMSGIAIAVVGVLQAYGLDLPYEAIYSTLAGLGLYGIRDAIAANK